MSDTVSNDFKLKLLLDGLRVTCCYFTGDEEVCKVSEMGSFVHDDDSCHVTCNCNGDINQCDLPERFQTL